MNRQTIDMATFYGSANRAILKRVLLDFLVYGHLYLQPHQLLHSARLLGYVVPALQALQADSTSGTTSNSMILRIGDEQAPGQTISYSISSTLSCLPTHQETSLRFRYNRRQWIAPPNARQIVSSLGPQAIGLALGISSFC